MLVTRPTQTHQVPLAGRPQIDPDARQMKVNTAPGTAKPRAAIVASGWRHTNSMKLATAIPVQPAMPSQADGTWMNRMRTVSPCSRSAGA